ncbi:MAG: VOC family protein [Pseudomonadota bacterium]
MRIERLDHLNIRTGQLGAMIAWYRDILGLREGPRPDFGFAGAWMYAGNVAVVHLVETPPPKDPGVDLKLEHGAFRANGFAMLMDRLKRTQERSEVSAVPGLPIVQVNLWDPDGNHLHIDFDAEDAAPHWP